MDKRELTQKIKDFALNDAGFDLVGVAPAALPALHGEALRRWLGKGRHGTMDYLSRPGVDRSDPKTVLPSAKSVISLAVNYYHPEDPRPEGPASGKVAQYAYGRDYHKVIEKKLKKLSAHVLALAGPGTEIKTYVDTGPILEKAFAREAGLGFFGKNTNIITRHFGSWVFLASLITNLELLEDEPHAGACGSCRICIDACPTSALLGDYELDATKCISYLTIESKTEPAPELKKMTGDWVFGCDICQQVCPYNFRAKTTRHEDLYPTKIAGSWVALDEVASMDEARFAAAFQGSPVKRPKMAGLARNAKIVAQNQRVV